MADGAAPPHSGCRDLAQAYADTFVLDGGEPVDVIAVDPGVPAASLVCPHKIEYWVVPVAWRKT